MNALDIQNAIIPRIFAVVGFPLVEADQMDRMEERLEGTHAVFKFTTPHGKDNGQADYTEQDTGAELRQSMVESVRVVLSITGIADKAHASIEAARALRDWFTFHGVEDMQDTGIAVISIGDIGNRDSVNEDETRNGFDVTLRTGREVSRVIEYFDAVAVNGADILKGEE